MGRGKKYQPEQVVNLLRQIEVAVANGKTTALPLGAPVESTHDKQSLAAIKVYPGADAEFTLYNDDGTTYAYEKGDRQITTLRWNDASRKLTHQGAKAWTGSDAGLIQVVQ